MSRAHGFELAAVMCIALTAAGCSSGSPGAAGSTSSSTTSTSMYPRIYEASTTTTLLKVPTVRGLTVSAVRVGRPVTFSGVGCEPGNVVDGGIGTGLSGARGVHAIPHADGTWSATETVPENMVPGPSLAQAFCERATNRSSYFVYTPVHIDVTTPLRLRLTPDTHITPGTSIRVTPNLGCPNLQGITVANVSITNPTFEPDEPIGPGASTTARLDRGGRWSARVTIPSNVPPGPYVVSASCVYFRTSSATYPNVTVTVVAAR